MTFGSWDLVRAAQALSSLSIKAPFIESLSISTLCKAILNIYAYRSGLSEESVKRLSWLQGYVVCIILGSAGSGTVSLLRGEPLDALAKNDFWLIYGFIYWLLFSNSFVYQCTSYILTKLPVIDIILTGISGMNRGYTLVQYGVEGVVNGVTTCSFIEEMVCGILTGYASGFWVELFGLKRLYWRISTTTLFLKPSIDLKISFYATIIYMSLCCIPIEKDVAQAISAVIFTCLHIYSKINRMPRPPVVNK